MEDYPVDIEELVITNSLFSVSIVPGSFSTDPTPVPNDLDQLPAELRERFPEVVDDLRTGVIDEVPDAGPCAKPVALVELMLVGITTCPVVQVAP